MNQKKPWYKSTSPGLENTVDPQYFEFRICEFACLLKFICNPKIGTCGAFMEIHKHGHAQSGEKLPAAVKQGNTLPSCFSFHTANVSFLQFM